MNGRRTAIALCIFCANDHQFSHGPGRGTESWPIKSAGTLGAYEQQPAVHAACCDMSPDMQLKTEKLVLENAMFMRLTTQVLLIMLLSNRDEPDAWTRPQPTKEKT